MRRVGFVLLVSVAALVAASCDSSQPSQGGSTTAEVQIDVRALTQLFDCYDRFRTDLGPDPVFDRIVCFPAPGPLLENRPVPWSFSFRILVLRAGNTFPEFLLDDEGRPVSSVNDDGDFADFGSTARFDLVEQSAPLKLPEPPFTFENARRISQGHEDYFLAYVEVPNGGGTRSPLPLPTVNILNEPPSSPGAAPRYAFELNAGDSIIVEASKQLLSLGPPVFPVGIVPDPRLSGRLFVGGSQTTPNAGTVESAATDGAGIAFNYISD